MLKMNKLNNVPYLLLLYFPTEFSPFAPRTDYDTVFMNGKILAGKPHLLMSSPMIYFHGFHGRFA